MASDRENDSPQRILVFQQNGSGERKIAGVRKHAGDLVAFEVWSIDMPLPPVLDDTSAYLPEKIEADLVLDFLKHQDLSYDLAERCVAQGIPIIASGKKINVKGIVTPPT